MRWPFWLWLILLPLTGTISFSIWAALGNTPAIFSSLLIFIALIFWSHTSALTIFVDDQILRVDHANLPLKFISKVEKLDEKEMSLARTREADPTSFLAMRFWVRSGVKIWLNDPQDPTKYWLVSTANPAQLLNEITRNPYTPL